MSVDVLDQRTKQWLPGTVKGVEKISKTQVALEVSKDGYPEEFNEKYNWPNPDLINYCGEEINDRVCDNKSVPPVKEGGIDVKICFTPKEDCIREG
jgi:hypothetical protein